jgi:hypothetical protein
MSAPKEIAFKYLQTGKCEDGIYSTHVEPILFNSILNHLTLDLQHGESQSTPRNRLFQVYAQSLW